MPHAKCGHCGTLIQDHSTMAQQNGSVYCCPNCMHHAMGHGGGSMQGQTCAHCGMAIIDTSTMVTRGSQTFCCNNCAMAMA